MQHKILALPSVRILLHPASLHASFRIPVTFVVILTIMFFNDSLSSVNNSCSSATLDGCVLLSNRTCCATMWLQASAREQTRNFMRIGRKGQPSCSLRCFLMVCFSCSPYSKYLAPQGGVFFFFVELKASPSAFQEKHLRRKQKEGGGGGGDDKGLMKSRFQSLVRKHIGTRRFTPYSRQL